MIGKKVLKDVQGKMEGLLDTYQEKINEAYIKAEGGLVVTMQIGFEPNVKRPDFLHVKVAISFTESKIKDMVEGDVSEAQDALFKAVEGLRPKKGSGIDSVTLSSPGRGSVTLKAKE